MDSDGKRIHSWIQSLVANAHSVQQKFINTCNPQGKAMIEHCHKAQNSMICVQGKRDKEDLAHLSFSLVFNVCSLRVSKPCTPQLMPPDMQHQHI